MYCDIQSKIEYTQAVIYTVSTGERKHAEMGPD